MKSTTPWLGLAALCVAAWVSAAEYSAQLGWERPVNLSLPVSGVITKVSVRPGQRVAKGDVLLELDPRLFRAAVQRAEAQRKKARYAHAEAVREFERTQEMFDRTLLSEHDRQMAEIAMVDAEADYETARAAVTEAQVALEYSRLHAPFDALVTQVQAAAGEALVSRLEARTLVSLVPAERLRATATLSAEQAAAVVFGADARVVVDGNEYPGKVTALIAELGGEPQQSVEVSFDAPAAGKAGPGRQALIRLEH